MVVLEAVIVGVADEVAAGKLTPPDAALDEVTEPAWITCGTALIPPAETADTGDTFDGPLRLGPAAEIGVAATASSGLGGMFVVG